MKTTTKFLGVWIVCAAALLSGGAYAQQYKWVDKDGRVRYGDVPPPGVKAKPLRPPSGPAQPSQDAGAKAPRTAAEQDAEFRKRRLEAQREQEKQAQAAEAERGRQENCANSRQLLATLESGERVVRTDPKTGERAFLDDAQRAGEITKARKLVSDWCGGN